MAASMEQAIISPEPAYCRLKLDIDDKTEQTLVESKTGLTIILKLQSLHEVLLKEKELIQCAIRYRQHQLRRDKTLQLLKRVKACLQRVQWMNRLFTLAADLLKDVTVYLSGEEQSYLPCQQSWTFLLYLLSQYHQLLNQTASYSFSTFQYLSCAITTKHLLKVIVIFMGISARVWQVCTGLSDGLASVFNSLRSIPQCMAASLSDWTCPDLPNELSRVDKSSLSVGKQDRDGVESSADSIPRIEDFASVSVDVLDSLQVLQSSDMDEDLGVSVKMNEYQTTAKRKAEMSEIINSCKAKKSKIEEKRIKKSKKKNIVIVDKLLHVVLPSSSVENINVFEDHNNSTECGFNKDISDNDEKISSNAGLSKISMIKFNDSFENESPTKLEGIKYLKLKKKKKKNFAAKDEAGGVPEVSFYQQGNGKKQLKKKKKFKNSVSKEEKRTMSAEALFDHKVPNEKRFKKKKKTKKMKMKQK